MEPRPIREAFGGMEDPRDGRNRRYPPVDVTGLAACGTLCGLADLANMAYWLKKHEGEPAEAFGLAAGVPSHDVFSKVFRIPDVQEFLGRLADWLSSALSCLAGQQVAIDGKAVIAATRKAARGKVPYVVSAYACGLGTGVCQLEIGDKSNETADIPRPVEMTGIEGCTVTIDAIGTQRRIMDPVVGKGGHFCLQPERNHKKAFEAASPRFSKKTGRLEDGAEPAEAGVDVFVEESHGHGRDEPGTHVTTALGGEDRAILPADWGHAGCVGMAVLEREVVGDPSRGSLEVHYHVMDTYRGAKEYAGLARGHWAEENSPRHVLDARFGEDRCTARKDNAVPDLTLPGKIVADVVRQVKGGKSTKAVMIDFMCDPGLFLPFPCERVPMLLAAGGSRA